MAYLKQARIFEDKLRGKSWIAKNKDRLYNILCKILSECISNIISNNHKTTSVNKDKLNSERESMPRISEGEIIIPKNIIEIFEQNFPATNSGFPAMTKQNSEQMANVGIKVKQHKQDDKIQGKVNQKKKWKKKLKNKQKLTRATSFNAETSIEMVQNKRETQYINVQSVCAFVLFLMIVLRDLLWNHSRWQMHKKICTFFSIRWLVLSVTKVGVINDWKHVKKKGNKTYSYTWVLILIAVTLFPNPGFAFDVPEANMETNTFGPRTRLSDSEYYSEIESRNESSNFYERDGITIPTSQVTPPEELDNNSILTTGVANLSENINVHDEEPYSFLHISREIDDTLDISDNVESTFYISHHFESQELQHNNTGYNQLSVLVDHESVQDELLQDLSLGQGQEQNTSLLRGDDSGEKTTVPLDQNNTANPQNFDRDEFVTIEINHGENSIMSLVSRHLTLGNIQHRIRHMVHQLLPCNNMEYHLHEITPTTQGLVYASDNYLNQRVEFNRVFVVILSSYQVYVRHQAKELCM